MKIRQKSLLVAFSIAVSVNPVLANDKDVEGEIESIDSSGQSFIVQGQHYHVTDATDYDDELKGFGDLRTGQRVEVDYMEREGRRVVTEIELDD